MVTLILGLALFLGTHSVRIFADDWRTAQRARHGEKMWKLGYTLISLIGFGLIIWGFGMAQRDALVLWNPPMAMRHISALLTLIAFILLAATYVPRNSIKASLHHPMVLGVSVWAFAHLLANGTLADLILFSSFLVWAILSYLAARNRDRVAGTRYPSGTMGGTLAAVGAGVAAWVLFAFWLHGLLIGVKPIP
ncbi:NnrU family protein [Noviherbaspirillum sedimenti]|uniref:Protein NrnU n=1 Tax=Noviherbaspirillum sedimenti TaxID=2320865 RepID=A0A3A3G571_9BURK|nr:NnrU family protein [Noviherbaspirillum sedimenti]RJG02825.1 protein NrnU [Noviherbaspirillum sedimenti]